MIVNVYAVRDIKAGYLQPMCESNDEVAARNFKFALTKPGTLEYSNIQDFDLLAIGSFDNDTGVLTPTEPRVVVCGSSLLRSEPKGE